MTMNAVADLLVAHLRVRGLSLADAEGKPLDPASAAYAAQELAELAAETRDFDPEKTQEIPSALLAHLRAACAGAPYVIARGGS